MWRTRSGATNGGSHCIPAQSPKPLISRKNGKWESRTELGGRAVNEARLAFHPCVTRQLLHFSLRSASVPSLAMSGTITSAPTGSAHQKLNRAFKTNPETRIADK